MERLMRVMGTRESGPNHLDETRTISCCSWNDNQPAMAVRVHRPHAKDDVFLGDGERHRHWSLRCSCRDLLHILPVGRGCLAPKYLIVLRASSRGVPG